MFVLGFSNSPNETVWLSLSSFDDNLPFPLSEPWYLQVLILILMLTTFCQGLKFRSLIIRYLMSPECKGPINALIWADQMNGIFLGLGILLKLAIILTPFPLAEVIGEGVCDWSSFLIGLYVAGAAAWRCAIAVFRVIILKGSTLIKDGKLSKILCLVCLGIHFGFGGLIASYDNKNVTRKMCLHYSDKKIESIELYQVILGKVVIENI